MHILAALAPLSGRTECVDVLRNEPGRSSPCRIDADGEYRHELVEERLDR